MGTLVSLNLAATDESQSGGVGGQGFFGSWFDKVFSWFGSFGSPFSKSVNIDVVKINNKSASLNCTVEEQRVEVKEGELLTLDWADMGKEAGDVVFVTCSGESSGSSASNQTEDSSWVSVSTVTQNLVVPGMEVEEEKKDNEESEEVEDDNDNSDDEGEDD